MNYLQLVQRVHIEAGLAGGGPSSFSSIDSIDRKIQSWVQRAWLELQAMREWPWLRRRLMFALTIGKQEYSLADLGAPPLFRWDMRFAVLNGGSLEWIDYQEHRERQAFQPTLLAQPHTIAALPDNALAFGCQPDRAYQVIVDYWASPQVLTAETDTPQMPEAYHDAIIQLALQRYAAHDGASELIGPAEMLFRQHYRRMVEHFFPLRGVQLRPLA